MPTEHADRLGNQLRRPKVGPSCHDKNNDTYTLNRRHVESSCSIHLPVIRKVIHHEDYPAICIMHQIHANVKLKFIALPGTHKGRGSL